MESPGNSAGSIGATFYLIGIWAHRRLFLFQFWDSAFLKVSEHIPEDCVAGVNFSKLFFG